MFKPLLRSPRDCLVSKKVHFDGDVSGNNETGTEVKIYTQPVSKLQEKKYSDRKKQIKKNKGKTYFKGC